MTDRNNRAEIRRFLGEASLLPPGDPIRVEAEEIVSSAGEWAEREWLALLAENDLLRLEMVRGDAPAGLERRLLRLADGEDVTDAPVPAPATPRRRRWLAAAAVATFFLALGGIWQMGHQDSLAASVEAIALLAIDDHVNDRQLVVATSDLEVFCRGACPHHRQLPSLGDSGCELLGGRSCAWGSCPIVYTLWERDGELYSLIRFPADALNLPGQMANRVVCCPQPGIDGHPTDIVVWAEGGAGYALTGPHAAVVELAASRKPDVVN